MPFLWKKVKSTRISRLVNDHLHNSQKRRDGSSLVVETGFPTSLIDLFIKNREKLKTPSKKKRRNPPICDADDQLIVGSSPPFPPPPPSPSLAGSLTPSHSPLRCHSPLHNLSVLPPPSRCVGEISAVGEKEGDDERVVADVNNVLFGVLKIFLVVVLALGTKRLAVGITISAFLLLFIEYVGRHLGVVSRLLRFKEIKLDEKKKKNEVLKIKSLDQEIQEVEESNCEEIQPVIEITDEPSLGYQESEAIEKEVKKKSRKAKIKSRMKKYVTKKFRSSKKQNELQRPEEQVDQCNNDGESGNTSASSSSSSSSSNSWRMYRDEDGAAREIRLLAEVIEEANTKTEVEAAGLTWRHLALCLIVLIGLLGGRAFALVLTLSCFLLLKLGQKLPRFIMPIKHKSG
ncbi:hypothetical protein ACS0TY_018938 [Phlomoides rotata]